MAGGQEAQAPQVAPVGEGRLGRLVRLSRLGRFLQPSPGPEAPPKTETGTKTGTGTRTGTGTKTGTIRAGGGVVWRRASGGGLEVVLVHRPKYDDWSLPKGKLHTGEDEVAAALREVEEETGLRCVLGPELAGSRYADRFGRDKTVRYWAMTPVPGSPEVESFVPNDEVDEVRWLSTADAGKLVSYDRDREILLSLRVEDEA